MEINLLALSAGNSRLAVGVFVAGTLKPVVRIPLDRPDEWKAAISKAWEKIDRLDSPAVAAATVNPALVELLDQAALDATAKTIEWVGEEIDLPIKVLTDQPKQTGVDRVLNIAAAYEQMQKACVVVDAGTAITIDLCDDKGHFLGGAIAPGAGMMLRSLHQHTALLPSIELDMPADSFFGKNTKQAMLHGVYHGIRGMLKEIVENYATHLGTWPEVIATGGDAEKLFGGWELIHAISPDLTLYGIALAYTEHHIRHRT